MEGALTLTANPVTSENSVAHRSRSIVLAFCATIAALEAGCGKSGSNPILRPEVRFEVIPSGQTSFRVLSLVAGGVNHPSVVSTDQQGTLVGPEFSISSTFNFVLEGAPPPFEGTFLQTGSGEIVVQLTQAGGPGDTAQTSGPGTIATVAVGPPIDPADIPPMPREVRFDVCAVAAGASSCSITDGTGTFGIGITGTLGDAFFSHVLQLPCPQGGQPCDATPAIYFLEAASEMANAVFRSAGGQELVAQLLVNGALKQTSSGTGNVIISKDL
jgi:hypothetical protein